MHRPRFSGHLNILFLPILALLVACNAANKEEQKQVDKKTDKDTIRRGNDRDRAEDSVATTGSYSNERFRNVTVQRIGTNTFRIRGQAQIFEATFSWVVEDGHEEIKTGYTMTDAGAPEWGNFDFTVQADKKDPNSTLVLILYEVSARDGSRQYELPIRLY
ncbi:MAG TPA: Gmad2 immunoglobulin-like domain-containing protein [Chitinophagaceae bacterium]|nr:Gmad2 immunoglobulin-like domain-containing protein [Chitinophagaceae bacterium]